MKILFVIPARSGSKGIPGKNLALLGGVPLVGHAARVARIAAQRLSVPSQVICSTDSPEIAAAAEAWGATVPFLRPAALASDTATSMQVVFHAIEEMEPAFDTVVLLQPTSPLVTPDDVVGAVELCQKTGCPVVSLSENEHPVGWALRLSEDGSMQALDAAEILRRRQDCVRTYTQNGAVFVSSVHDLRQHGDFVHARTRGFVMAQARSIDIDTPAQLSVARALWAGRQVRSLRLANREVGPGQRCFIIAEAGVNHNGDLDLARRLVDEAAAVGADAVKFQTWKTENICQPGAAKAAYQERSESADNDQFSMLKRLELPYAWHAELKARAEALGLVFLSTPDDLESARFLCDLGVEVLKVGSAELTNLPHLEELARLGRPLILSTGMSSLAEVAQALETVRAVSDQPVAVLHCVSAYPAPEEEMNLRAITTLRDAFQVPVGLSDHTVGGTAAELAVALGATILEKHFTLDRAMPGPDHAASANPEEFAALVKGVRRAEVMLGNGVKALTPAEADTRRAVYRSLCYARGLLAGHVVAAGDFQALRSGRLGLPPTHAAKLVGRALRQAVQAGDLVQPEDAL